MAKIRLYHGTAYDFAAFDGRFVMRGTEPNSALGIHLTETPALAADYAELAARDIHAGSPRVLVLDVEIGKAAIVTSAEDFLGREMDMPLDAEVMRSREEFVAARHELEANGFHAVAVDCLQDDLAGAWTVFDPGRITVVGSLSLDEALEMDTDGVDCSEMEMVSVSLFEDEAGLSPS